LLHFRNQVGSIFCNVGVKAGMDNVTAVNKGITDKGKFVSRNDGAHSESKASRFQHIDDRNTDQKPNARSFTVSLVNALKGKFYAAVSGGGISVGSPDVVLDLCEGAKHHQANFLGNANAPHADSGNRM
jgi:hypothetical protein